MSTRGSRQVDAVKARNVAVFEEVPLIEDKIPAPLRFMPCSSIQQSKVVGLQDFLGRDLGGSVYLYCMHFENEKSRKFNAKNAIGFLGGQSKTIQCFSLVAPLNLPNLMIVVACDAILLSWHRLKQNGLEQRPTSQQFLRKDDVDEWMSTKLKDKSITCFHDVVVVCKSILQHICSNKTVVEEDRDELVSEVVSQIRNHYFTLVKSTSALNVSLIIP
jgi:hypothetical protein